MANFTLGHTFYLDTRSSHVCLLELSEQLFFDPLKKSVSRFGVFYRSPKSVGRLLFSLFFQNIFTTYILRPFLRSQEFQESRNLAIFKNVLKSVHIIYTSKTRADVYSTHFWFWRFWEFLKFWKILKTSSLEKLAWAAPVDLRFEEFKKLKWHKNVVSSKVVSSCPCWSWLNKIWKVKMKIFSTCQFTLNLTWFLSCAC